MSTTSLTAQLTRRRRSFTGETASTATPAMRNAIAALTPAQQTAVPDVLHGHDVRTTAEPVVAAARAILLPEATSPHQQELESRILLAIGTAIPHLQLRPPVSVLRPTRPIRAVELPTTTQHPSLHLDPYGLGPLLMGLLPQATDAEVYGVPRLRYRQHRRHGELLLLETDPPARVLLAGVDVAAWKAALAFVTASYTGKVAWLWNGPHEKRLTGIERDHLTQFSQVYGPAHLGSSLLRRLRLLPDAQSVDTNLTKSWVWTWTADIHPTAIANQLADPLFGLPLPMTVTSPARDTVELVEQNDTPHATRFTTNGIRLRRDSAPDHRIEQQVRQRYPDTWPAWKTWEDTRRGRPATTSAAHALARQQAAQRRADYTGEQIESAAAGLTAADTIGLDDCTTPQRTLRSLLAIYLLNTSTIGAPPSWRGVYTTLRYTMTISPRHDDLLIFADAPDNLVQYFVDPPHRLGVPGLRVQRRLPGRHFQLVHLPTGATCTITGRREADLGLNMPTPQLPHWHGQSPTLTQAETTDLAAIPSASPDMETLLAGLFVRIACTSPDRRWAIGKGAFLPE